MAPFTPVSMCCFGGIAITFSDNSSLMLLAFNYQKVALEKQLLLVEALYKTHLNVPGKKQS